MAELLSNFGVDWRLLLSQVVNFAILFFLLKKFAYQPVLAMLRKRKGAIEEGITMRAEAERTLGEIETLKVAAQTEAQEKALALVTQAEVTAGERREEIVRAAVTQGEVLVAQAQKHAEQEAEKMRDAVTHEAEQLVRDGITHVLGQLPAEARDEALIRDALSAVRTVQRI